MPRRALGLHLMIHLMWAYILKAGRLDANMAIRSHLNNLGCAEFPLLDTFLGGVPVRCGFAVVEGCVSLLPRLATVAGGFSRSSRIRLNGIPPQVYRASGVDTTH